MNKSFRFTYILFFFLLCFVRVSVAQTAFQLEKDLIKQGEKLFEEKKYVEAYPIYSQLVIRAPQDALYNYRLGVCSIFAMPNKELAIPFLETAIANSIIENDAHYYLGRAFLLSYHFEEAAKQFKIYKSKVPSKDAEKYNVNQQIAMCANGSKLVRNIADWIVVEKKDLNRKDFFIAYDLSTIGGKLLVKPNETKFNTAIDLKKKEESLIFLSRDNRKIFFSSYGNDETHGKDIYQMTKLPNGEWGQVQALPNTVNTDADEDYPFFHPNGKVLYFSSKGHSSMGGYDIFKSTYDTEKNSWGKPENIGFPINSPDDDILYATDTLEKEVYFSSSRTALPNKISVYKLNIEKKPTEWIIIKGIIKKNRDGQSQSATITVKNYQDNSRIGIFNSNANTGKYFLVLPNGINCVFTVESPGFKSQSQLITVPLRFESNSIKQELSYELTTDKLMIKTISENFNEEEYDEIVPVGARNKAVVNRSTFKVPDETKTEEGDYGNSVPIRGLNNKDIVGMAYGDAKDLDEEAIELKKQAEVAGSLANQKNDLALQKSKEAQTLNQQATQFTGDPERKKILLDNANTAIKEADELKQDAAAAYKLAKKMEASSTTKRKEADLSLQYAQALDGSAKTKNSPESMAKVSEIEKQLDDLNKNTVDTISIFNSYKMGMESKQKELDKALKNVNEIKKEITDNEVLIAKSQGEADKTRNKSLKEGLLHEIEGLKQDNEDREKELKKYESKAKKTQDEYNSLAKESSMAGDVVNMAKKKETPPATIAQDKKAPAIIPAKPVVEEFNYDQLLAEINEQNAEKIDAATEIKDEIDREISKGKAYSVWYDALNTLSEEQKLNHSKEKNTQNKLQLSKLITHATQQAKEKKLLADQANAKAARLKAARELLAKNTIAPKPLLSETFKLDFTKLLNDLNARNAEKIVLANKEETDVERESAKASAFYEWANELNKFVTEIKTKTITEADKNVNTKIGANVVKAKRMAQEKKVLGDQCAARALKLKLMAATAAAQAKTIATPTVTPKPQPAIVDNQVVNLKGELALAEKIQDVETREKTKEAIYKKIAKNAEEEISNLRISYNKQEDPDKAVLIANKIKVQENILRENKALAKKSLAAADNAAKNKTITPPVVAVLPPKQVAVVKPPVKIEKPIAKKEEPRVVTKPVPVSAPAPPIAREIVPANELYNRYIQVKSEIKLAKNEKFDVKQQAGYSDQKPIPTTGVSKNGLVYTVQVGAFLNPIPQGTFGGITPITAEPTNTGYMRYFAGQFNKYATADNVKVQIRGIGFKDAFVVAYYNGRRITLTEALRIENGGAPPSEQELANLPVTMPGYNNGANDSQSTTPVTTITNSNSNIATTNNRISTSANGNNNNITNNNGSSATDNNTAIDNTNTNINKNGSASGTATTDANSNINGTNGQMQNSSPSLSSGSVGGKIASAPAPSESLSGINGLFYTVQVGLFSQPVSSDVFYNLNPLFNETTETGKTRYTIGIYNNIARAIEAKQIAVNSGINNSFITAFYNSKRITLSEARQIEANGGDVFTNSPVLNILPYVGESNQVAVTSPALTGVNTDAIKNVETAANTKQNTIPVTNERKSQPSIPPVSNSKTSMEDITFKVQIGAYKGEVPAEKASVFSKLNVKGFASYVNENGLTIYTVGNFKTYEETVTLKLELAEQYGLTDVFVVAFRNGKKIPLSEVKIR